MNQDNLLALVKNFPKKQTMAQGFITCLCVSYSWGSFDASM